MDAAAAARVTTSDVLAEAIGQAIELPGGEQAIVTADTDDEPVILEEDRRNTRYYAPTGAEGFRWYLFTAAGEPIARGGAVLTFAKDARQRLAAFLLETGRITEG